MAGKGCRARGGAPWGKWVTRRHGGGGKGKRRIRGANAVEKAIETIERRNAKEEIRDALDDLGKEE
jgi:hypothetical protein